MRISCDWDDTLVDVHTQEWLPGALERLRALAAEHDVFVHTCRANWPEGHASVEAKLAAAGLHLEVVGGRARNARAARKACGRTVNGIVVY